MHLGQHAGKMAESMAVLREASQAEGKAMESKR
jgi:hypothetical protein